MKRAVTKPRAVADDIVERIDWLLRTYWSGSQAEMARELGCSQAAISKVLNRKTKPGRRLLKLISDHARVAPQWLCSGEGPNPPAHRQAQKARTLPVTRVLLSGPPNEHAGKLEGEEFPVAEAMYRPTRCWLDLPHNATILDTDDPLLVLQPHDLLLLDYGLTEHQERLASTDEIVVAWVTPNTGKEPDRRLAIGVMKHYSIEDENPMWLETGRSIYRSFRNVKNVQANLSARDPTTGRTVNLGVRTVPALIASDGSIQAINEHQFDSESFPIQPGDIVAVCIGMFRRL